MIQKELFSSKKFWDRYFWNLHDEFSYEILGDNPFRFHLTENHTLLLDPGEDLAYISLSFQYKAEDELEIAWDDEAHFHPFVLRFHEFQVMVDKIAAVDDLEKWIPALLLRRFVGIESFAELQTISAWELEMRKASGLFTEDELHAWFEKSKQDHENFWDNCDRKWSYQEPFGWVFEGNDAYSLRSSANSHFPFEQWNRMLAELGC